MIKFNILPIITMKIFIPLEINSGFLDIWNIKHILYNCYMLKQYGNKILPYYYKILSCICIIKVRSTSIITVKMYYRSLWLNGINKQLIYLCPQCLWNTWVTKLNNQFLFNQLFSLNLHLYVIYFIKLNSFLRW